MNNTARIPIIIAAIIRTIQIHIRTLAKTLFLSLTRAMIINTIEAGADNPTATVAVAIIGPEIAGKGISKPTIVLNIPITKLEKKLIINNTSDQMQYG